MPDYFVTIEGVDPIPVRAGNSAAARNFAVRNKVKVEPLTIDQAIAFGKAGVDILDATSEPADPEATPAPATEPVTEPGKA